MNGQTWPRALNTAIGGAADDIFLIVADVRPSIPVQSWSKALADLFASLQLGSPSGSGLDFINGFTFLERFYSVFDTTNSQVGFAQTAHTFDETN